MVSSGRPIEWRDQAPTGSDVPGQTDGRGAQMQVKLVPARTQEHDRVAVYTLVDFQDDINDALRDLKRNGYMPVDVNFGECELRNHSYTYLRKFAAISYWVDE